MADKESPRPEANTMAETLNTAITKLRSLLAPGADTDPTGAPRPNEKSRHESFYFEAHQSALTSAIKRLEELANAGSASPRLKDVKEDLDNAAKALYCDFAELLAERAIVANLRAKRNDASAVVNELVEALREERAGLSTRERRQWEERLQAELAAALRAHQAAQAALQESFAPYIDEVELLRKELDTLRKLLKEELYSERAAKILENERAARKTDAAVADAKLAAERRRAEEAERRFDLFSAEMKASLRAAETEVNAARRAAQQSRELAATSVAQAKRANERADTVLERIAPIRARMVAQAAMRRSFELWRKETRCTRLVTEARTSAAREVEFATGELRAKLKTLTAISKDEKARLQDRIDELEGQLYQQQEDVRRGATVWSFTPLQPPMSAEARVDRAADGLRREPDVSIARGMEMHPLRPKVWTSVQEWKEREVNWPDDPRKRPDDPWAFLYTREGQENVKRPAVRVQLPERRDADGRHGKGGGGRGRSRSPTGGARLTPRGYGQQDFHRQQREGAPLSPGRGGAIAERLLMRGDKRAGGWAGGGRGGDEYGYGYGADGGGFGLGQDLPSASGRDGLRPGPSYGGGGYDQQQPAGSSIMSRLQQGQGGAGPPPLVAGGAGAGGGGGTILARLGEAQQQQQQAYGASDPYGRHAAPLSPRGGGGALDGGMYDRGGGGAAAQAGRQQGDPRRDASPQQRQPGGSSAARLSSPGRGAAEKDLAEWEGIRSRYLPAGGGGTGGSRPGGGGAPGRAERPQRPSAQGTAAPAGQEGLAQRSGAGAPPSSAAGAHGANGWSSGGAQQQQQGPNPPTKEASLSHLGGGAGGAASSSQGGAAGGRDAAAAGSSASIDAGGAAPSSRPPAPKNQGSFTFG